MNARSHARTDTLPLLGRLWEAIHGPVEVTPVHERDASWERLRELEDAAAQLEAILRVEAERDADGDER